MKILLQHGRNKVKFRDSCQNTNVAPRSSNQRACLMLSGKILEKNEEIGFLK